MARIILPEGGNGPGGPRTCGAAGCEKTTREQKPFCPDHVDQNPYVREIMGALSESDAERKSVKKKGPKAVHLGGIVVNEIILHLELHGRRTVERLAKELQVDIKTLNPYLTRLKKEGKIVFGTNRRKNTTVGLKSQEQ